MTLEERAGAVVMDYHGKRCWGYDPVQYAEYEQLIAAAIRDAVAAERERCAKLLEEWATAVRTLPPDQDYTDYDDIKQRIVESGSLRFGAARIRKGEAFDGTYPVAAERAARIGEPVREETNG